MIKTTFAFAAALAFVPAVAQADEIANTEAFTHKGVDYSYTTEVKGDTKIVRGTAYAGKVPFELRVKNKSVDGTFNNRPVHFELRDVQKLGLLGER